MPVVVSHVPRTSAGAAQAAARGEQQNQHDKSPGNRLFRKEGAGSLPEPPSHRPALTSANLSPPPCAEPRERCVVPEFTVRRSLGPPTRAYFRALGSGDPSYKSTTPPSSRGQFLCRSGQRRFVRRTRGGSTPPVGQKRRLLGPASGRGPTPCTPAAKGRRPPNRHSR